MKIVKQEIYYENEFYTKIVDENGIIQHFKEENEKLENSFNEEFVTLFFRELIKARNIYREALIKQKLEKEKKKFLKKIINSFTKNKSLEIICKHNFVNNANSLIRIGHDRDRDWAGVSRFFLNTDPDFSIIFRIFQSVLEWDQYPQIWEERRLSYLNHYSKSRFYVEIPIPPNSSSNRTAVSARIAGSDRSERLQQFSVQTTKKFTIPYPAT